MVLGKLNFFIFYMLGYILLNNELQLVMSLLYCNIIYF